MRGPSKPKKAAKKSRHVPKDLHELEREELSGYDSEPSSLDATSTDENENEALGDGKMGRSRNDILGK